MIRSASRCLQALLLGLLCMPAQAQLQLELDPHNLNPAQQEASQQLLVDAWERLPPSFVQRLDRRVTVSWTQNLTQDVIGRTLSPSRIELNARYLEALTQDAAPKQQPSRGHRSMQQELLATLLHELLHLYDRSAWFSPEQRRLNARCAAQYQSNGSVGLASQCRGQQARRFSLSDDPRLLDLAGWQQATSQRGAREPHNGQRTRSPDLYELSNPREFVAVNFEYFLLDPSYVCRRPGLQRFFSQHFNFSAKQTECPTDYPYLNAGFDPQRELLGALDPKRVYQVHYLLAEPNQNWASRWGHSMLRLVICAPETSFGPDCLLDLEEHLVLSYRAYVGDVQLSSWDGLVGAYPSRLFILPLSQVVDEYTKAELRDLSSIALKLSRSELDGFLERTFEQHWSYDGDYFFLSNNCAVETLKLLRSGTARADLQTLDSITPTGLLEVLEARGIADSSPLQDRQKALRQGYLFDSYQERYQSLFNVLREQLPIEQKDLHSWLDLPATQRSQWIEQSNLRSAAALLLLEKAAFRRQLLLAQEELKQRYLSQRKLLEEDSATLRLLQNSGFLSRPAELLGQDSGYGLPQQNERQRLNSISQERHAQLSALTENLESELTELLSPERRAQLQQGKANLDAIGQHLRQLHQQSNGLQLP